VTQPPAPTQTTAPISPVAVVVCAFTAERLDVTCAAVQALRAQATPPAELFVVVDHNEPLLAALAERLPGVTVLANEGPKGLSGGRNTGLRHATTPIVAFVDDDAEAQPGWTEAIVAPFADAAVVAVGGFVRPRWDGKAPGWFPPELLWAVGCSYRGMVTQGAVRNPLGANMAFRADVVRRAGEFDPALGRVGSLPFGCEETELCVRIRRMEPDARVVIAPGAVVAHHVPPARTPVMATTPARSRAPASARRSSSPTRRTPDRSPRRAPPASSSARTLPRHWVSSITRSRTAMCPRSTRASSSTGSR
jgi:cellulose synthase/poly-beta-1,6-N-acetylglucosamine synthase-like glycosyltransferase